MNRTILAAAMALTLVAPMSATAQPAPAMPDLDAQVRCAALFAIVAAEQNRKAPGSDRYPALQERGRDFFVSTGLRLIRERQMAEGQIEPYFRAQISVIQQDFGKADSPQARTDAEMAVCLKMLDAVPPLPPRS